MDFTKMSGAGNDFILIESGDTPTLDPRTIRTLCDRRHGIGADGLMRVSGTPNGGAGSGEGDTVPSFSVDFYNADGSGGMLCGNGARCSLVYAALRGLIPFGSQRAFSFAGRLYRGRALGQDRAVFLLDPNYATRTEEDLSVGAARFRGRFVDLGSLHLVIDIAGLQTDNPGLADTPLDTLDVAGFGAALRNHERFAPDGVNVNFCSLKQGILRVRTFERGVEGETLACGTGSTASALSFALAGLVKPPVRVLTRSGEELVIDFDEPARPTRLSLEGPAKAVFRGQAELSDFSQGR